MRPHASDQAPSSTDVGVVAILYTYLLGTIKWKKLDTPEALLTK